VGCSLPGFHVEDFLLTLSQRKAAEGAMDFTASWSARGPSRKELVQSAPGSMSLHSAGNDQV
jgi:hypothetical protein